jgi:hypothetical protein
LDEGFTLGGQILDMIPDRFGEEKRVWSDFMRAAVTRRDVGVELSAVATVWIRKDPFANGALTDWFLSLIAQVTTPLPTRLGQADSAPAASGFPGPPRPVQTMPGGAVAAHAAAQFLGPPPPDATMPGGAVIPSPERNGRGAQLDTAIGGENARASLPPEPATGGDGGGPPLFHTGERGVELTMTTIDLLQAMTERLAHGSAPTRSATKNYDWVELEYLFERVGALRVNGSFTGLGAESLPEFFQALATARGERANTRLFAERYRATHYPRNGTQYDFVWTTQLLKDLKSLTFGGDDLVCGYTNRFRGLSVFSLAPISESSMAAGSSLRQRMLQFEMTESNHSPADASEMAKLSASWNTIPGTRYETAAWVEHIGIMTRMLLGDACPMNQHFDAVRDSLRKPHLFGTWTDGEWRAFIWSLHMAYRAFMIDTSVAPLAYLAADLEARRRPDVKVLPEELAQTNRGAYNDEQAGRKRPAEAPPNAGRSANQIGNPAADSLAAHLASMLALAKPRTSKNLKISTLLPTDGDAERIIGPEFMALSIPRGKPPCWRHHIYGGCAERNNCRWAHGLRNKPSPQLLEGIARRMQQRLNDIIQQHPK